MTKEQKFGHLAMLGASVMWGLMAPISKAAMNSDAVSAMLVADVRIFGAAILFWIFSLFTKGEKITHKSDYIRFFFAGLFAIILNQCVYVTGVSMTSPVDASIITTTLPIVTMIFAAIFIKEPITGRKIMGIAAGAAGALLLILSGNGRGGGIPGENRILGDMLVLLAQCSYALYIVLFKNFVGKYSPVTIMKWMFTYSFICLLPFSYTGLMATDWVSFNAETICGISFIVVGGTFLSYILVIVGQKILRPTVAGMYNYVQPVVAAVVAVYWGLDSFSLGKMLSVVLIFAGVYLVTTSKSRADMERQDSMAE